MKKYVGIDLGGTNIAVGVVDEDCNIIAKSSVETQGWRPFETVVADIGRLVETVVRKAGLTMEDISSVGMGTPSCIEPKTGLLVHANNMGWKNVPLYGELKKHIEKPLFIRNDADCAALGEVVAGGAMDYEHVLMITLGTGVGGGVIMGKKIFSGCDSMGAELGHMKLVFDGLRCTCGKKGCFEAYGSATALINQTKKAIKSHPYSKMAELCNGRLSKVDGRVAFDAAKLGDAVALKVVDKYISYVAAGISSLVAIFRPEVIIIGGGLCNEGEYLLAPLNKKIAEYTFSADEIGTPPAIAAKLGNDAGIIGAAMLEQCR